MPEHDRPFGHEPSAIAVRRVLIIGAILALVALTSVLVLHFVLRDWVMPRHAGLVLRPDLIPPEPRLQPSPQNDLAEFRAQKEALLSGYAWVDVSHTYARIPVTRAMQIYAQQHAQPASGATSGAPR
ncbi:MAG: hypothetical protein ACREPP_02150 [Rhodanobacteraceae bacterium]